MLAFSLLCRPQARQQHLSAVIAADTPASVGSNRSSSSRCSQCSSSKRCWQLRPACSSSSSSSQVCSSGCRCICSCLGMRCRRPRALQAAAPASTLPALPKTKSRRTCSVWSRHSPSGATPRPCSKAARAARRAATPSISSRSSSKAQAPGTAAAVVRGSSAAAAAALQQQQGGPQAGSRRCSSAGAAPRPRYTAKVCDFGFSQCLRVGRATAAPRRRARSRTRPQRCCAAATCRRRRTSTPLASYCGSCSPASTPSEG
ncbi:hypothetical protein COO60DRAFT_1122564 [Scenedesmus sp. NREL 46B-D3]|nr:hypothetical protein COO60DRAFT_1122564 [Scenedesmus sp. NREL 46B-D3]